MILIASGAYLQGEFVSEVGLLPPSFLPIGNKRLFEYQVEFLKQSEIECADLYLSIPDSYQIDEYDKQRLAELKVEVIRVQEGLSLGDSILFCWNASGKQYKTLTLLHGDTLFLNAKFFTENGISVHPNRGFYQRATLGKEIEALEKVHDDWANEHELVISGYFRFMQPLLFMKSLVGAKSDFIKAIINYHQDVPLALIKQGDWLDFGHINMFFHSRTKVTTERAFNELNMTARVISKSSQENGKKIYAEGRWFEELPLPLRLYTPSLLGLEKGQQNYRSAIYQLEYLYLLPLSDLYVFSRLTKDVWHTIFNSISKMLSDFAVYKPEKMELNTLDEFNQLYLPKTIQRLELYSEQSSFDLDQTFNLTSNEVSLVDIAMKSAQFIQPIGQKDIVVSHGDLCFSNMLFDTRVESIKCIDPRGITPKGGFTIFGDRRYDLAKLYHSVVGLYDFIIAGRYGYKPNHSFPALVINHNLPEYVNIIESFKELVLKPAGYEEKEILAITIHLFLSMLPLHSDRSDRQKAFIANAIRLFNLLNEMKE